MKIKICDVNATAAEKLPGRMEDKSGIGLHYVDAYIKAMNVKLEDGTAVRCKRRGAEDHVLGRDEEGRRVDAAAKCFCRCSARATERPVRLLLG